MQNLSINTVHNIDCLVGLKLMAPSSVDCIVTSPPYFGLRDYGHGDQIGLEQKPEEYVDNLLQVFTECHRVLKPEGTLWLNLGDSYAGSMNGMQKQGGDEWKAKSRNLTARKDCANYEVLKQRKSKRGRKEDGVTKWGGGNAYSGGGLKPKDLIGIPWRMAFALQGFAVVPMYSFGEWADILKEAREKKDWIAVDFVEGILRRVDILSNLKGSGWYLRQDIIWHKPNPMPESVTDRCTKSHEYIFLLSKSLKYYYDIDAIRTPVKDSTVQRMMQQIDSQKGSDRVPGKTNGAMKAVGPGRKPAPQDNRGDNQGSPHGIKAYSHRGSRDKKLTGHSGNFDSNGNLIGDGMANKKSVWSVTTKPFSEAHFATFPEDLIVDCIKAGCPEGGVVLDPFMGAGTTAIVARKLNRNFIGFELNPEYLKISEKRLRNELGLFL